MKIVTRIICSCLVVFVAGLFAAQRFDKSQQMVLNNTARAMALSKPAYALDETAFSSAMQTVANANPGMGLSISVNDLQTGKRYHYGEPAAYTAASIAKLFTAVLFLQESEAGKVSLTQQIGGMSAQSQLEKLIVDSDNDAWYALNSVLTHQSLVDYARSIGISSYDADANTVTSDDVALLLTKLASGKLLRNTDRTLLLSYLQRASMRGYLVAGAPAGATVYHKTGYLSDRLHDAAIVKKGDRSFVLVVFSKTAGDYDFAQGADVFKGLSASASSIFFGQQ